MTFANLTRDSLLVAVKANPLTYPATGGATTGATTAPIGTMFRSMGKKIVTPAQGSAPGTNQVHLLKVSQLSTATNVAGSGVGSTPSEGDSTTGCVYINLLDGMVARV